MKNKASEGDCVVCVQQYPEDGDQADILFINLTTLLADQHPDCKKYAKYVLRAIADKQKIAGSQNFDFADDEVLKHQIDLPCIVSESVTIYNC